MTSLINQHFMNLKNELVFTKGGKVWSNSLIFSKEFDVRHMHVLEKIKTLIDENESIEPWFISSIHTSSRGSKYPMYLMNRQGYMFLVMNVYTKRTNDVKIQFINAFDAMEIALKNQQEVSWQEGRQLGKGVRQMETDIIKEFVEYAFDQGSKNAKMYYANITKMTYKALELIDNNKTTPIRDLLSKWELWKLQLGEAHATLAMKRGMAEGLHYKEIYILAKQEVQKIGDVCQAYLPNETKKLT